MGALIDLIDDFRKKREKYYLVPSRELEGPRDTLPLLPHIVRTLDRRIQAILHDSTIQDPHIKSRLYSDAINRFLTLKQERDGMTEEEPVSVSVHIPEAEPIIKGKKVEVPTQTDQDEDKKESKITFPQESVQALAGTLPLSLRESGRRMLTHLRTHSDMNWMADGRLMYQGRMLGRDVNIVSLLHYALRNRPSITTPPKGWHRFEDILEDSNLPIDIYLKNPDARRAFETRQQREKQMQTSPWLHYTQEDEHGKGERVKKRRLDMDIEDSGLG